MIDRLRKLLFSRYSTTMLTSLTILVAGLINSILQARLLGADGRGEIAAAMLWPTLLVYLGALGQSEATLYFASQEGSSSTEIYSNALFVVCLQSIAAIGLGFLLLPTLLAAQSPRIVELSRAALMVIPLGMLMGHAASVFRSQLRMASYNTLSLILPVGYMSGVVVLAVLNSLTVESAVVLQVGLHILGLAYALFLLVRHRLFSRLLPNFSTMRKMFSYGIRVYIGTIFSASLRLDQVLLAAWVTPELLGLYVVADKMGAISSVLTPVVGAVAVPKIARHADLNMRVRELTGIFKNFFLTTLLIKLLFVVALPIALPLIYGEEFRGSVLVAEILVVASLFYDCKTLLTGGAQALNMPGLASVAEIVVSIMTVVLLLLLLPVLGIVGAGLTSLTAYATSMFLIIRGLERKRGLKIAPLFRVDQSAVSLVKELRNLVKARG